MTKSQINGALINVKHSQPALNTRNQTARIHVVKDRKHYLVSTLSDDLKPNRIFSEFEVDAEGNIIIQPYFF